MKNKILFFNSFYPNVRGGAELQAREIANICLEEKMEVVYISIEDKTIEAINIDGIKVYVIKNPNNKLNNFTLYYFFMQELFKIIDIEKPDIIYQRILNSFSPYLAKYSNKNNIPFLLHVANTHCFNFTNSFRDKIRLYLFNQLKKYEVHYIAQTIEQEKLLENHQLKSSLLMPNLYNIKSSLEKDIEKPFKVLWVANIRPIKQLELFLELAESLIEWPIKFIVIGRIENKNQVSYYNDKMNVLSNLDYLGELSNEDVNTYLSKAFLLVNSSKSEGFSNTFIQAWASGTPIVSLNSNPNNYLVERSVGYFANGNILDMKKAIINYFNNSDLYKEHSNNAVNLFNNDLAYNKSRNKIITFIKSKI